MFTDARDNTLDGMYTPVEKAELVLKMLVEGSSIATVARITGIHHGTIFKILTLAGEKCERIMAKRIVNVQVRDVECDELWSFVGKKQKRVKPDDDPNFGDAYTFVAIERHSKLVLNIAMGKRNQQTTDVFIEGLRHATARGQFQITTDGFARTAQRSLRRSMTRSAASPNSSRSTVRPRTVKPATAPPKSSPWR
ncbi:MAG TPA: hypothetical protein VGN17_03420 [Bryobacteraceae bacterium]